MNLSNVTFRLLGINNRKVDVGIGECQCCVKYGWKKHGWLMVDVCSTHKQHYNNNLLCYSSMWVVIYQKTVHNEMIRWDCLLKPKSHYHPIHQNERIQVSSKKDTYLDHSSIYTLEADIRICYVIHMLYIWYNIYIRYILCITENCCFIIIRFGILTFHMYCKYIIYTPFLGD